MTGEYRIVGGRLIELTTDTKSIGTLEELTNRRQLIIEDLERVDRNIALFDQIEEEEPNEEETESNQ